MLRRSQIQFISQLIIWIFIINGSQSKRIIAKPKVFQQDQDNSEVLIIKDFQMKFILEENRQVLSLKESSQFMNFAQEYKQTHFKTNPNANQIMKIDVILKNLDHFSTIKDFQDESYKINIETSGYAIFQCQGYTSFLRAYQTFLNLFNQYGEIEFLPIKIEDSPSYKYRGIMLDSSRHFLPVDVIQKTIRGMFIAKFNVLHWHIVDHESFPPILQGLEELSSYGAYSEEETYSQRQIEDVILYAQNYGIIVIPEFDSPGHTQSWLQSPKYQNLNPCPDLLLYGQIDPTMDEAYTLVQKVFKQVQEIFPSNYFHVGGDEVYGECYDQRPSIKEFMDKNNLKDYIELQHYYNEKINNFIENDKYRIFWFDADTKNLKYPDNSIIQFWGDTDQYNLLYNYTEPIILSSNEYLYFDLGTGGWRGPGTAGSFIPWYKVYQFTPSDSNLGDRLLGAEATLWSEMINYQSLDWKLWPRASALGLRLWNENEQLNLEQLVTQLVEINQQLINTGIQPAPVTKEYCERNIEKCFKGKQIDDKSVLQLLEF